MEPDIARTEMLARRRARSPEEVRRASEVVVRRLLALPELDGSLRIGAYLGVRGEVDPSTLCDIDRLEVALPVTTPGEPLRFLIPTGPIGDGPHGTRQPGEGIEVDTRDLDVVVVPVVAADSLGHRVGHGAGYYDRTFADRRGFPPPPVLIGICHSFQLVERLESRPWDVPLDLLVTDAGITRPRMAHSRPQMGED
ncbi:MAG: 5-formyltetrahydrofolate cyclo-ligase [Acidimicrobiales bacterium]|jgi:5-formyltetrahydrofolate cyclo-ligase|nr:5-formyltetrahydrofolate cyclo-ligase [Acidimicrobiales bacterium]MDP7125196.1 5-formyltetrahydrofolate cyclo-ligase [Acidimicrobiales bacterium]MDP7352663.1 5-formyltetrahydrofolate cyclo-ligase [Acidimicrobiales bacterium]|tara:strand:+ start:29569 stop:30156 length:588 start_codon:yes stop_codon:yes gene_type:complete